MEKRFRISSVLWSLVLAQAPALPCSVIGCIDHGPEFARNFVLRVRHQGKPLGGVRVDITGRLNTGQLTGPDGQARFTNLPAGDYWLRTDLLGISAGEQCFHVSDTRNRRAKHAIDYTWGDEPYATRQVSGVILDSQPGTGGNAIWNVTHRVRVPMVNVKLSLTNPVSRQALYDRSRADGSFSFDQVPEGVYVLHIERGNVGREFSAANLLIRISMRSPREKLVLLRAETGCGGETVEFDDRP